MVATVHDIAAKVGVSVSTVSRVLNSKAKSYRISKKTEKLVLQAAKDLNYRPNHIARGLRLKKTQTIGLVVPDISNPFFAYVTRTIQTCAAEFDYSLIVCNTDENQDTEIRQIELLRSKGVDGFLIMPVGIFYDHIKQLLDDHIPMVLIDRCFDDLKTNSVVVDDYKGAFEAVELLIKNGHRRIAMIRGLPDTYTTNARVNGYKDALTKYNLPVDEGLIVGNDFREENGYIETKFLLKQLNKPTAIFTSSDLITLGALKAIYEEKNRVPEDISLVAFDDTDYYTFLTCPLTAVSQPKDIMGQVAVKLLIDNIKNSGSEEKKRIVLEPELIVRKSVAPIG